MTAKTLSIRNLSIEFGGVHAVEDVSFDVEPGEVFAIIKDELLLNGADAAQIEHFDEETDSLTAAMRWAQPGDLVIMLALGGAKKIQTLLKFW